MTPGAGRQSLRQLADSARAACSLPPAVCFDSLTPEAACQAARVCDGLIITDDIARLIAQHASAAIAPVCAYLKSIGRAIADARQ